MSQIRRRRALPACPLGATPNFAHHHLGVRELVNRVTARFILRTGSAGSKDTGRSRLAGPGSEIEAKPLVQLRD
jgi:hypothetical protein